MKQLLKQLVSISRPSSSSSAEGTITQTTTEVYSDLPASVQPASSSVSYFYAQQQQKVTATAFVSGTIDLVRGDKLTAGGNTYRIIGSRDLAGRGQVTAIDLELWGPTETTSEPEVFSASLDFSDSRNSMYLAAGF